MTKAEAIQAMREGNKVTHGYFSDHEYITMRGNVIFTEKGYSLWANEFWSYRTGDAWETGWSLFKN